MANDLLKWKVQVKQETGSRLESYIPAPGQWIGFLGDNQDNLFNPSYPTGYVFLRDMNGVLITPIAFAVRKTGCPSHRKATVPLPVESAN